MLRYTRARPDVRTFAAIVGYKVEHGNASDALTMICSLGVTLEAAWDLVDNWPQSIPNRALTRIRYDGIHTPITLNEYRTVRLSLAARACVGATILHWDWNAVLSSALTIVEERKAEMKKSEE